MPLYNQLSKIFKNLVSDLVIFILVIEVNNKDITLNQVFYIYYPIWFCKYHLSYDPDRYD